MPDRPPPRLYVNHPLAAHGDFALAPEQSHYLAHVMRRGAGDEVLLFNGRDGEWLAEVAQVAKRGVTVAPRRQTRPQAAPCDLWLLFAPIKRQRVDLLAEKASELGASVLQPVITRRTAVERVNLERLAAHAAEAAEQCGLLSVPQVRAPLALDSALADWDETRKILFCDEGGGAPPARAALARAAPGPWAVLIGPEGGFDARERAMLEAHPAALAVSLGPRIMRADTAAVAALALFQAMLGDWR